MLFQDIKNGRFYLGDCLEVMKDIPDGVVDMILCDLPYGTTTCKWDIIIPFEPLWKEYERVIKPNGAIVLTAQTPFDKVLGCSNLPMLKYEWIWEKSHATGHLNAKKAPMKAHENVLVFYNKPPTYNPIKTTGHKGMNAVYAKGDEISDDVYGKYQVGVNNNKGCTERYPRTVIQFPSDKQKTALHPTQKPVSLFEYFIKTYTNEGDVVLDNCAGSGTTAISCENTNRRWICIEKDTEHANVAVNRIITHNALPYVVAEPTPIVLAEPETFVIANIAVQGSD